MSGIATALVDCAILLIIFQWVKSLRFRRSATGTSSPPGPKGYLLIGNVLDMMVSQLWIAAQEWGKRFGGMIYLKGFGQSILIINSYDIAVELLERRSTNYSDRPNSVMVNELQRWDWMFANLPYGDLWKRKRFPLQKFLEPSNIAQYEDLQKNEVQKLLARLLRTPADFQAHISTSIASSMMMLMYGHEVSSLDDRFVDLALKSIDQLMLAMRPGAYLVDALPILKHLPKWCPGAGFHARAEEGLKLSRDLQWVPYTYARDKMLSGSAIRSFISQRIEECLGPDGRLSEADEENISAAAGVCFIAGFDTTVATLQCFFLAMTLFPDAQKSAQDEIDRVIGSERLPALSDRSQLPYCAALIREVLRWQPVSPLGLAHASREDDVYNGYFIPAKTIVIANQWAMLRDPTEYPDPSAFNPERFLPAPGERIQRDPSKVAFGFGRRACPGKHFAESMMFLTISQILAVFSISKPRDGEGKIIEPVVEFSLDGVVHRPKPFTCEIKPRSKEIASLIPMI